MSVPQRLQALHVGFESILDAPSAAVRTITPASSGMTRLRIDLQRDCARCRGVCG